MLRHHYHLPCVQSLQMCVCIHVIWCTKIPLLSDNEGMVNSLNAGLCNESWGVIINFGGYGINWTTCWCGRQSGRPLASTVDIHWAVVELTARFENSQWLRRCLQSTCVEMSDPVELKQLHVVYPVQVLRRSESVTGNAYPCIVSFEWYKFGVECCVHPWSYASLCNVLWLGVSILDVELNLWKHYVEENDLFNGFIYDWEIWLAFAESRSWEVHFALVW